jgi:hypothetical protein
VQPIEDVSDVSGFDAYVVGSAVYAGRWMGEVVHMVGVGAWANAIAESLTAASGAESTQSAPIASTLQHTVTNTMRYLVSPARRAFR